MSDGIIAVTEVASILVKVKICEFFFFSAD